MKWEWPFTITTFVYLFLVIDVLAIGVEDAQYQLDIQQLVQPHPLELTTHDEDASSNPFAPWSHRPVCTVRVDAIGSELCVYTNESFADGRGLSLFTTPTLAHELATILGQDARVWADPTVNGLTHAWYTQTTGHKGIGMFAKRGLERGDVITAYTPILLAYSENVLAPHEREKFLQLAVDQLPAPSRDAYLQLATVYGNPRIVAQDIAAANTFELRLGDTQHLAVFPETSRINHACAPNAQFYVDPASLTHWVHAVRPIAANEEITIAYSSPLQPFAQRRRHLQDAFHFLCDCPRCRRGPAADKVLAEIVALQAGLADWSARSAAPVKQAERLVQIHKDEGLDGYLDPAYCHAALTYNAAGSARGSRKYLQLAIEAIRLRLGPSAPDLQAWKDMLQSPESHWSWRMRKR